ncbi:MAG: CCA tRNA nucleotidyltransferase [bacterium]|nr:CCA tRNA nucleotidyltransferase [bacterium]
MTLATIRAAAAVLVPWGRQFAAAGAWRLYVVGGAVRSLLGGTPLGPRDEVDMTTDARPETVRRILGGWADTVWTQGEQFGTVGCRRGQRTVEITTHRAEVYVEDSRRPEVTYGGDLLADLTRRDFTIGAMAFEVPASAAAATTTELIDPFGGREDLERGRLRTPRSAELSFSEDPLRILRAGRFVATLGLTAEPDLEAAMRRLRGRLAIVSAERCARELSLLLVAESPGAGADLLARTGVLVEIIPELAAAEPDAAAGVALLDLVAPEESLRLAALLWAVPDVGASAGRLRFPGAVARRAGRIATAARSLLDAASAPSGDAPVRRWAAEAGDVSAPAAQLATAAAPDDAGVAAFVERWEQLWSRGELSALQPLSGSEVMAHLGIDAGPDVGAALRHLEELRIAGGPLDGDEARRRLSEWWERGRKRRADR